MLNYLHILQQLITLDKSIFLMLCLNEFKPVGVLRLLSSVDQVGGRSYLTECFPKRTVSNRRKSKSLFEEVQEEVLSKNMGNI